jgi:hypothetical protein
MDKSTAIRDIYSSVVTVNDETCTDKDGNIIDIDESLVNAKIAENEYKEKRQAEYPSIADQLDDIYHNGIDGWKATIKAVKDKYPKE